VLGGFAFQRMDGLRSRPPKIPRLCTLLGWHGRRGPRRESDRETQLLGDAFFQLCDEGRVAEREGHGEQQKGCEKDVV
jgi:hypothetical protein